MTKIDKNIMISVVIPLFNEEESLVELTNLLESNLSKICNDKWEIIFVDDGSKDKSFSILKDLNQKNDKIKVVKFRKNYGKSAALSVGFEKAEGEIVITMDADLQDDPKEMENLVNKINEGYDLVSGWKKIRYDPIGKTLPSKIFNLMCSFATGIRLHDFNCGLKAYRKVVVKTLHVYGEMHRFLPALAFHDGFKVTEIPVQHHPRKYGSSKFGTSRMFKGFLDLITVTFLTRFMKKPMHFFGGIGLLMIFIGVLLNLTLVIEKLLGNTFLSNRPLFLIAIAITIVGVQSVSMGLLGEMMVKNQKQNEIYSIEDEL